MFEIANGVKLEKWLEGVGISRSTGYTWIREGMLTPTNIMGMYYVTRQDDERFWVRAELGEFKAETKRVKKEAEAVCG